MQLNGVEPGIVHYALDEFRLRVDEQSDRSYERWEFLDDRRGIRRRNVPWAAFIEDEPQGVDTQVDRQLRIKQRRDPTIFYPYATQWHLRFVQISLPLERAEPRSLSRIGNRSEAVGNRGQIFDHLRRIVVTI